MTEKICSILLAAGGGTRFHGPAHKLLAGIGGSTVFGLAVAAARGAAVGPLIVVTGAVELPLVGDEHVIIVHNPRWSDGQAGSLQVGIEQASALGVDVVVVGLGDQPFVTADAWRAVAAHPTPIAVATYAGIRGNPVRLHRSIWPLLPREGDHGARNLMLTHPELVGEVACDGSPADIDTMEDLRQWNSSTNSP